MIKYSLSFITTHEQSDTVCQKAELHNIQHSMTCTFTPGIMRRMIQLAKEFAGVSMVVDF